MRVIVGEAAGGAEGKTGAGGKGRRVLLRLASALRRGWVFALGALGTFMLMANEGRVPHGPLLGMLTMAVAVVGMLRLTGVERGLEAAPPWLRSTFGPLPGEPAWMAPQYTAPVAACLSLAGGILFGYPGLPYALIAGVVVLGFSALRRLGLAVFVLGSLLLLPSLGVYGLWDPWETHYGEVAREMLARDDWISLWWAQEDWFWSKPILIFWTEALAMGALGVSYLPDTNAAHPEWALRLPHYGMAMCALMASYFAVGRHFGRRAGLVAGLVLATTPHFFLLAHQAITDIPFVANMTVAVCMLALAVSEDESSEVKRYAIGPFTFTAQHAVVVLLTAICVPQMLYLASRNVTLVDWHLFAWHRDTFLFGSAGNQGVPGNSPHRMDELPFADAVLSARMANGNPWAAFLFVLSQPMMQAALWALGFFFLVRMVTRERRVRGLFLFVFYVFCGLAFMGKGIPGFALPGAVALLYLISTRRWKLLSGGELRVAPGILTVAVVGLPWYVAMYVRHGPAFTDRLLVHDHINRLAAGVHGDTGSIEYFIEQLGAGVFPWLALAPAAFAAWAWQRNRQSESADAAHVDGQTHTLIVFGLWCVAAFTLFSAMITKFHHYIFPAVPPIALLVGVLLDRVLETRPLPWARSLSVTGLAAVSALALVLGVAGMWGDVRGVVPGGLGDADQVDWVLSHPWSGAVTWPLLGLSVLTFAYAVYWAGSSRGASTDDAAGEAHDPRYAIVFAIAVAIVAFTGRDLAWVTDVRPVGYERLIHLFVYNYGREWPEQFDFRPILTGFVIVTGVFLGVAVFHALRAVAVRALLATSLLFAAWCLDVYLVDLSPHWGQRELMKRYYEERASAQEPLIAWQMNWKGENFYTGNRVYAFADLDNKKLREWMDQNRGKRAFFVLEHGRLGSFRGVMSGHTVREISTERENNKFILVEATL